MPETDDTLLDLSTWPAQPPSPPVARVALPLRRRRVRRLPLGLKGASLLLLGLGASLLLVPLSGCGPSLAGALREPLPAPADTTPALDDEQLKADADAVRRAEAELAAWKAPSPARPAATPRPHTVVVGAASPDEVRAAQAEVSAAQRQVTSDQAELDRLLERQEQSDDPGAYDGQVAAAREQLEASVARLDEAQSALAAARSRTTRVTVRPSAPPASRPTPATGRTELVAAVADARKAQSAHLAARQQRLASARAEQQRKVAEVGAHNAQVRTCGKRSAVPLRAGLGCLVLGAAGLVRHRLTV
jgi:hypothetical protein